jgi:hypothetical protein
MWQLLSVRLPVPLRNFGAVVMPDGVLIIGGHDGLQP